MNWRQLHNDKYMNTILYFDLKEERQSPKNLGPADSSLRCFVWNPDFLNLMTQLF